MAKFVIECPNCGKYAQARTGFFAKKTVDCACGYTIDIRAEKLSSRVCPHCGNHVVYDQTKGAKAKCPVCGEPINTLEHQDKTITFPCRQCGIQLHTLKGVSSYTCPVCDHVNDVAEQLKKEQIKQEGLPSIIKYEGDSDTLVWKHPVEDFNCGSQLIVHESQEAVFFRNGQALDLFRAGNYTLETQQLPLMDQQYPLPDNLGGTFHSEVYYVNTASQMGLKWGTDSKVRLFDPMTGMHVELGASGECNIRIINSRKLLLKLVGTTGGLKQDALLSAGGKGLFRAMVMTQVKSFLASAIRERNIGVLEIDERLMELSEALRERINPYLFDYGLEMSEFFVSRVVTPDDDPNFRQAKNLFAAQYLGVRNEQVKKNVAVAAADRKTVEAQTAAQMKIINAQADAEAYRLRAAAEADEMRMKGYTYQQETARMVGMEAMQNGGMGSGVMGEIAGVGVTLGAMGSVMSMTRDAMNPVMDSAVQMGQAIGSSATWDCACGNKGITAKFCGECGAKKPEGHATWDCPNCGNKGITAKFCGECGAKKPEGPATWDCPNCGNKGITGKFCGECGSRKP